MIIPYLKRMMPTFGLTLSLMGCSGAAVYDNGSACIDYINDAPLKAHNKEYTLPDQYIDLRVEEGRNRLDTCSLCDDFPSLATAYLTQATQTFCGVASSTMVLNADKPSHDFRPVEQPYKPFHFYTQCNLLNSNVKKKIDVNKVLREGMELSEINFILSQQPSTASVVCHHASNDRLEHMGEREEELGKCEVQDTQKSALGEIKRALSTPQQYVIVNFAKAPYESRGGHFSPIAAYHEESDSYLIMDVARYKYPPFWITADNLWRSMKTIDKDSGMSRGFIVVTTKSKK